MIDRTHLAKYTLGDAALEQEVLDLFRTHARTQAEQLANAVGDPAHWYAATHGIKGSARGIGAWQLAAAAEAAELDKAAPAEAQMRHVACLLSLIDATTAEITFEATELG